MINYAKNLGYEGVYAINSHPMLAIFKRSGWLISVVEQGMSEKTKNLFDLHACRCRKSEYIDTSNKQRIITCK